MKCKIVLRFVALLLVFTLLGSAFAQDDMVTVVYWDEPQSPGAEVVINQIIENFEAANPGVDVVREVIGWEVLRDIAKTSIEAGEGPDIMYYDAGPGYMGILATAGLLYPLDDAYEQYGWDDRLVPTSRAFTTFDGSVYGVGHELEGGGLYWNKTIFAEEGLEPPANMDELMALCGAFRELGYDVPMAAGWADINGMALTHNWYPILQNLVGPDMIAAAISGEHPWTDPGIVEAMNIVAGDMVEAGCFSEDAGSLGFLEGNMLFYSSQAPMMQMSTWAMQFLTFQYLIVDEIGFMAYPPFEGKPGAFKMSLGGTWVVIGDTEHPDETLALLDYFVSEEALPLWMEAKLLPVLSGIDYSQFDLPPVYADFTTLVSNWTGPVGYHVDILTPAHFTTVMWEGLPEVAAGRRTAEEHAANMQAEMDKAIEEGTNFDITG